MAFLREWFQSPSYLLLLAPVLPLLVVDIVRRWGTASIGRRIASAFVRLLAVAGLVVALADPRWHEREEVAHVVLVIDRSASIPDAALGDALARADAIRTELAGLARPGRWGSDVQVGLVLFDATPEVAVVPGQPWTMPSPARTEPVDATDIDAALALALGLIPADDGGEIVLFSDGRQTTATSSSPSVEQAKARGVRIHTMTIEPRASDPAIGAVVLADALVRPGSSIEGHVEIDGAAPTSGPSGAGETTRGTLTVKVGDEVVHTESVEIAAGEQVRVPFSHQLDARAEPGTKEVTAELQPNREDADPTNNRGAATLVIGDPPSVRVFAGEEIDATAMARALRAERMDVQVVKVEELQPAHEDLSDVDLVVLANAPAASIGGSRALQPAFLDDLARFVDNGGGLIVTGGPMAYDMGGYGQSKLDRVLPVKLDPVDPEVQSGATIIIVLDRSGSMSAMVGFSKTKMQLADEGAAASIALLRPFDRVGVMSVTETVRWEVPTQPVRDPASLKRKVLRVRADGGGIFVYTALDAAYKALETVDTPLKHVILFSDAADSEEKVKGIPFGGGPGPTSQDYARKQRLDGVTTSVIGIGTDDDIDTPFLKELAKAGGGRFYLTADATKLRALFVEETERLVDSSLHEVKFRPTLARNHPIVREIDYGTGPQLTGYQEVEARPTAEVVLMGPEQHPLLTTWRYGLGHVVAWSSDAGPRWSEKWLTWDGFAKQWTQAARFALRSHAGDDTAVEVEFAGGRAQLRIARRDTKGLTIDEGAVRARLKGVDDHAPPGLGGGGDLEVPLTSLEPGLWQGSVPVEQGRSYTVEVVGDKQVLGAEPGATEEKVLATHTFAPPPSAERRYRKADPDWLRRVAERTEGEVEPESIAPQAAAGVTTDVHRLCPWALLFALVMLPLDAMMRRPARAV
jgi:Ca-activated chloride channel family protein